jgi:tetratricopeptide (TPR) repeat protein
MIAAGNMDAAAAHLENAAKAAGEIEHNEERLRALVDIGNLYLDANRNDRAVETFDAARSEAEALDNVHRDAFMAAAAAGLFRAGSLELADRALDLVADQTHTASCLLGYAREYWRRDERDEAMDALEEAYTILKSQRENETRNSKSRFQLFTSIAAQFAGFEKGERAIEIAHGIADESEQTSGLIQVAEILTLRKEDEQARHALQAIADDSNRVFALIRMSDAKTKNGDSADAAGLLDEAFHLAETVPQLSARSTAYNEIARRYAAAGEKQKAAEISRLNLQTIGTIRDESRRVTAITDVAELFAESGMELSPEVRETLLKLLG